MNTHTGANLMLCQLRRAAAAMAGLFIILATTNSRAAAVVVDGPNDTALRAAIAAAQAGDTITVNSSVQLQSTIRIEKPLTIRSDSSPLFVELRGTFDGALFQIAADGVTFANLALSGSPQTDGLLVDKNVLIQDCMLKSLRDPVVDGRVFAVRAIVRLERVLVTNNAQPLMCVNLEAKDSTFSSSGDGAFSWNAKVEGCVFEHNRGTGLQLLNGTVTNSTFHSNGGGLRSEADPGVITLSNSVFYANEFVGLFLGEGVIATVDNCTFTRHTGPPAVIATEVADVIFRHCTVADNVYIRSGYEHLPAGAFAADARFEGAIKLQNCLVANNPTDASPDGSGLVGAWVDRGGNVIGGSANLGPLRDNGGPTRSLAPLPGSPAIDAGIISDIMSDTRGLSRLAGAAPDAGAVEFNAGPRADTDGDGIPDIWEILHGLNPSSAADAALDTDHDGRTALEEFSSRTDPASRDSVFEAEHFVLFEATPGTIIEPAQPASVRFTWKRVPGVVYQVESSADLLHWNRVPGIVEFGAYRNGDIILSFSSPPEPSRSFYRVTAGANPID